jgi:hypothetical protein
LLKALLCLDICFSYASLACSPIIPVFISLPLNYLDLGSRFACLSLTVSQCYKSERSIEGREGMYLTREAEFVRLTKELSMALGEGGGL